MNTYHLNIFVCKLRYQLNLTMILINLLKTFNTLHICFSFNYKQDSQAIQYTSEVVHDTILKYIKTIIICFGWGGSAPPDP